MRRLVVSLAIITALATSGAWAAVITWTGATDNDVGVASNWDANRFPNNDDAFFTNTGTYKDNEVVFTAACANKWITYVNNVGTAEAPLVFRATDPSYGLRFGNQSNKKYTSLIGNSGAAYLRLKSGTWSASFLQLDNGQLSLTDGASLSVDKDTFVNKADSKVAVTDGARFYTKGYFCHRAGEVTVENGTLEVADSSYEVGQYGDTSLLLNEGGLLIIKYIDGVKNSNTILFNGGTLRSNKGNATLVEDNSVITVKVGALGGTIDANTIAVSFPRPIAADGENDGGMTFKGGGSVTLKYANTYTGETKIAVRTKLVVTSEELARLLANGGIKVIKPEGVSAKGTFKLLGKSDGSCTAAEYALITKGTGLEGATFAIDEDGDITVTVSHTPQTWAGAAETSATWSGNNWDDGVAFDDGNDAVFATDGAIAEVDDDFSAYTLTFNDNAALTGTGTLTVPTITVAEGKTASIAASLAGPIEKTGAGTLTLGSTRAGTTTTLSEGTLVANAPVGTLVLGTDTAKPVTFDYGGQTYYSSTYINGGLEVTLANCTFSSFYRVANGTVHVAKNAMVYRSGWITVGPESDEADTHAVLDICGGVVSNATKNIVIGDYGLLGSSAEVRVRNGGLLAATSNGIIVGSRAAATLTIDEGTVVAQYDILFCDSSSEVVSGEDSFVNLNAGGLLWVRSITYGSGAANATFTFNGGTLKANQDYTLIANKLNMSVVTDTSGTIDADGHAVTIAKAISGEGGMAYQGGGKVTFTAQPTYTGVTTVEVGTTLVVPAAIAGDKLSFTVPGELADGVYTVVSISGDSQFADDVVDGQGEGFVLSPDKKKICYVKGMDTTKPIYIGTDGNLSAAGNWLDGTVPTGGTGDAQIFCTAASTLTVGDAFAPAKLVILDGSALVTIGSGTLYVGEVVNRNLLIVGASATVVIGNQLTLGKGESICDRINGSLVVSNLLLKVEQGDRYVTRDQEASVPGVFKFEAITNSMANSWFYFADKTRATTNVVYIGKGGLNFLNASGSASYCLGGTGSACLTTIRPWYGDFAIEDSGTVKYSLALLRDVTFCTDDENGIGRTITLNGKTFADTYSPKITVSGSGTLQVNNGNVNLVQPPVTVKDTATLAFAAGASLSTGEITLGAGTTLALTATGREFTPLANTLNLPTEGVAKIRIDGARLKTGVHEIATVGKGTSANVEPDLDGEALGGRRARFEVAEGGKLLLNIKSSGTLIIVR